MDISILEDIGLTNAEIKTYLALLEIGESTAGPIINHTGLQNSVIHMTLHKLTNKGFLSYIIKGKVKYYQCTDPENILKYLDNKRNKFESLLPELKVRQKPAETQHAEIYVGYKGFQNAYRELLKDAKKGDEYLFFAFYTADKQELKKVYAFFAELYHERKKMGVIGKGIVKKELMPILKNRDMREFLFVDFPVPTNMTILNDKIIMNAWEDGNINLLIHSKQLAEVYRQFFYSIWNKYRAKDTKVKNEHKSRL